MVSKRYGRNFSLALEFTKPIRLGYGINQACGDDLAMLHYYKAMVNLTLHDNSYEDGITRHEAAFLISDTIWSKSAQMNPEIKKIAELASELELPSSDQTQYDLSWNKLVRLIQLATQQEFDKPG